MNPQLYQVKPTGKERWGIYLNDRLLATCGSYDICQSLEESLNHSLSPEDNLKQEIAYQKALDRSLVIRQRF